MLNFLRTFGQILVLLGTTHASLSIRKCCPDGQSYNLSNRRCEWNIEANNLFHKYYTNVVFKSGPFDCRESAVEYIWEINKYDFEDGKFMDDERLLRSDSYCLDSFVYDAKFVKSEKNKSRFFVKACANSRICKDIPCVRKCCYSNQIFKGDEELQCERQLGDNQDLNIIFHRRNDLNNNFTVVRPEEFGILRGQNCLKYRLEPNDYPEDVHYFDHKDGSLFIPSTQESYDHSKYCIEFVQMEHNAVEAFTFVCYEGEQKDTIRFILYPAGLGASSVFCLITLLVYLCVPKLRNLPGKILICLVLCLMVSYVILAMGQLNTLEPGSGCYMKAFLLYFSFLGAFTWTNVMSIDIWLVFSSSRNSHLSSKRQQTKKLILYMLYGWGLPATLTLLMVAIDNWLPIAEEFRPHFGENRCWFENFKLTSHILYFILPAGILILSNIILFILTLRYCNKVKRELFRMQSTNEEKPILRQRLTIHKTRLTMNIKMFIVMGVSFALEIVSTLAYNRSSLYFWLLTDFLNTLHGVFIFFIFVFKKKVWYAILDRLGIKYKGSYKSPPSRSTTTTSTVPSHLLRLKSTEDVSHNLLRLKSTESIPKNLVRLKSTDD